MSILAEILSAKVGEVREAKSRRGVAELRAACADVSAPRGFARALVRGPGEPVRVIAEIKRASPSAGVIRADADPAIIAAGYAGGGASAISVLTDSRHFDGDLSFLAAARGAADLPLLRKDFLIDAYQVIEARAAGADAVLVIVAALDDAQLSELIGAADELGMDSLVEVHDVAEANRAVAAGARVIGVNHRNLATFEIDMSLTGRLRCHVPEGTVLVGESGIKTGADIAELGRAGADAVLVGETLMRAPDPGAALGALLGDAR